MRLFIHQLLLLVLSSLTVYALLLGVTLLCVPPQRQTTGLDTAQAARTLYATEPKYVFLNRGTLDSPRDKVLLLWASNVVVGLQQRQLQGLLPGLEVDNLGVGGSNVTQVSQVVDLVHEVQSAEARRHNNFVIGIWYGLFVDDRQRWSQPNRHNGDTDIDIERYRYGFFRRTDNGPVALLPPEWLDVGVRLIHPYLVIDKLVRDLTKPAREIAADKASVPGNTQHKVSVSEQEKRRYLAFWEDYMGGSGKLSGDQFDALISLVDRIIATGGRVTIVDLPLPAWHEKLSRYQVDYQRRLRHLFDILNTRPGVVVTQMRKDIPEDDFSDEVHPQLNVTQLWAQQLAIALNKQMDVDTPHLVNGSAHATTAESRVAIETQAR